MTPPTITETLVAHFYVRGDPKPYSPGGQIIYPRGRKPFVKIYSNVDEDWREDVARAVERLGRRDTLTMPLGLEIDFFFHRPDYMHESKYPRGPIMYAVRPDSDNLLKSTCDAMTKAKFWADDSLVCSTAARKWYAAIGQDPGAIIAVYERTAGDEQLGLELPDAPLQPIAVPTPRPHVLCNKCGFAGEPLNEKGEHYRRDGSPCRYLGVPIPPKCPTCKVRPVDPDGEGMCAACFGARIEAEALAEERR